MPRCRRWQVDEGVGSLCPQELVYAPSSYFVHSPLFGPGARRPFSAYLTGESHVQVSSIEDIQDWLLGCQYEDDEILFAEPDFWQHPVTFERLRAGDCEDFALWAWRKLIDIKVDADFVVGYSLPNEKFDARHAWVVFRRNGEEFLFETVARERKKMIYPLSEVRDMYIPQFGVGPDGNRFAFTGFLVAEHRKRAAASTTDHRVKLQ